MRRLDFWIALNVIIVASCLAWATKNALATAETKSASAQLSLTALRPGVP